MCINNIKGVLTDTIMKGRYDYTLALNKLGYNCSIDNDDLIINHKLESCSMSNGIILDCHDLRGGMAILIASLLALHDNKCTEIYLKKYEQVERGYPNMIELLDKLNTKIQKCE
jgi:UDP-N-acetylglucosamine enolpyruvyl transferase